MVYPPAPPPRQEVLFLLNRALVGWSRDVNRDTTFYHTFLGLTNDHLKCESGRQRGGWDPRRKNWDARSITERIPSFGDTELVPMYCHRYAALCLEAMAMTAITASCKNYLGIIRYYCQFNKKIIALLATMYRWISDSPQVNRLPTAQCLVGLSVWST